MIFKLHDGVSISHFFGKILPCCKVLARLSLLYIQISDLSLICDSSGTSESTPGSTTGCKVATETPVTQAPVTQEPATGSSGTEDTENEHDMDAMGYVLTNQMTGNIILPSAEPGTTSREIHVKFYATCASAARPNFWYATLGKLKLKLVANVKKLIITGLKFVF